MSRLPITPTDQDERLHETFVELTDEQRTAFLEACRLMRENFDGVMLIFVTRSKSDSRIVGSMAQNSNPVDGDSLPTLRTLYRFAYECLQKPLDWL